MALRASDHHDRRRKSSHRYDGDVESDADEGLTQTKPSRRLSRQEEKASVYRQLKEVERVQREVAPSNLSSEEIHVHYFPIFSNSPTNPFKSRHQLGLPSNKHEIHKSKPQADNNTDTTVPHTSRLERARSPSQERSRKSPSRRSKHGHEKHGKHGKKVDPYLEPLKQRWICYQCGRIRSDKIGERHPLAVDQKMQPNWCGRCRITHEYNGKPLSWYGQRHYCWGCGIVRSEKYHRENEIKPGQSSGPNYCRPCREASPGYEHNLREASEIGGEATSFDKAFMRQVHDANLSDIEEDKDGHSSTSKRAPGKENDARAGLLKSREATSSMLKNRSFKTKASSDTSSDGNVTINKLKEMHLEADKTLNFGGKTRDGGARLSAASSYKPPSVESVSGCSSMVGRDVKSFHVSHRDTGHLAQPGGNGDFEMKDAGFDTADKACQADISSTIRAYPSGPDTAASPMDIHQSGSGSRPTASGTNDSGVSRKFPSGTSRTSASSIRFRARRNPAEPSTGSPPQRDGFAVDGNIGDKLRYGALGSGAWTQQPTYNGSQEMPAQGSFGSAHQFDSMAGGYANGQKLTDFLMPPTPPLESHWQNTGTQQQNLDCDPYMMNQHEWADQFSQPSAPNAYSHRMSPGKPGAYGAHNGTGGFGPGVGAEYTANPGYFGRPHNGFNSAAHFSDAHCRRDFSGDSYYEPPPEDQFEYNKPSYPGGGVSQTQQGYQPQQSYQYGNQNEYIPRPEYVPRPQYVPQPQYGAQTQYSTQNQYGFQDEPGNWAEHNGNGFSQQGAALGGDSSYSAPKEFDFSFIGQGNNSEWAANTYVPTHEEINAYMERNCTNPGPQMTTPRAERQWTIYEDEDDGAVREQQRQGYDPRVGASAWSDGKTSVHHVSSTTPGNTVTILSIREITSDEDLSPKFDGGRGDGDEGKFLSP
ncbi:hypothetical protein SLS64_002173 [Diaporthe eres]